MKRLFFALILLQVAGTLLAQITPGAIIKKEGVPVKDSIIFYEEEVGSRQMGYPLLLQGEWQITSMKQPSGSEAQLLNGVVINLNADSTFKGMAGCNQYSGSFSLKGTSIRFQNIRSTKKACPLLEQENAFLQLLQKAVSRYAVTSNHLLLRDGSGNIIFEAVKTKE